jgi:hypothetical protein
MSHSHAKSTLTPAFQIEAVVNMLTFPFITHPEFVLSHILLYPSQINPSVILFTRLFGTVIAGITGPLLFFAARSAPEVRKAAYWSLGLGEALMVPLLVGEAMKGGEARNGATLSVKAAVVALGSVAAPLAWRAYTLFSKSQWFGRSGRKD